MFFSTGLDGMLMLAHCITLKEDLRKLYHKTSLNFFVG